MRSVPRRSSTELVLVGSGSYSPTQQGIPTHRYGGPALLRHTTASNVHTRVHHPISTAKVAIHSGTQHTAKRRRLRTRTDDSSSQRLSRNRHTCCQAILGLWTNTNLQVMLPSTFRTANTWRAYGKHASSGSVKVEFMESANMLGARPSTRSHPAHSSVMYVGSEQCSYFAYFEQSTDPCYIIPETRMSIHRSLLHILNYPPSTDT